MDQLEYMLGQEKAINTNLVKEVDCCEEALREAQKRIDCRDDVMTKVETQIKNLE